MCYDVGYCLCLCAVGMLCWLLCRRLYTLVLHILMSKYIVDSSTRILNKILKKFQLFIPFLFVCFLFLLLLSIIVSNNDTNF
jgi:hypothetical protein